MSASVNFKREIDRQLPAHFETFKTLMLIVGS
jgi:hypothetical protein